MLAWARRLRPGSLFIDVGANVGIYSLWAADHGAKVIAIEPGPAVDSLRRNVSLNALPIEVIEAAATDVPGPVAIDVSRPDVYVALGGQTLVEGVTLDGVLGDQVADGLKIDVEGAERLVLEGATRALAEQRLRCIQLEWNECSWDLLGEPRWLTAELLESFGYALFRPDEAGRLLPCDAREGPDVFALPGPAARYGDTHT